MPCSSAFRRMVATLGLVTVFMAGATTFGATAAGAEPVTLGPIREEARRLRGELAREAWEAATVGRAVRRAGILAAHQELLSPGTLTAVRLFRADAADSAETARLDRLELDLARWTILAGVAALDEEIEGRLASVTATVEDYPKPLTLAEIDQWIGQDVDSLRVRMLESARLGLWRDRIDPLLDRRRSAVDSLAIALGYNGYTEFAMRLRRADPELILKGLFEFLRSTDTMYQVLGKELALSAPGAPTRPAARAAVRLTPRDFRRLAWADTWDRYVEPAPELVRAWVSAPAAVDPSRPVPVVESVRPAASLEGRATVVDDVTDAAAVVAAIDSPGDIRVAVPDLTGMAAARAALAAAGAARQKNGTAEASAEWRDGGPDLLAMTAARLSRDLVSMPEWYEARRRDDRASGRDTDVTRLSDLNLARLIRWQLWNDLRRVRTEIAAQLLAGLIRHRAGTDYWMPYVFAPAAADEHDVIRQIRGFACGVDLAAVDSYDAFAERGDFLPELDEARAIALAAAVEEHLVESIGPEWFVDGDLRLEAVFATPDGLAAASEADIARVVAGAAAFDFAPLVRRCERRFDWSERLLETAR